MPGTTLSLDDLAALNQQIAALARVGAPLEGGLRQFANETPGRLGQAAAQISEHLARGESLADAAAELKGVPPVYAAIVEAGARAGRLPAALEGLADAARRMSQLRRSAGLALAYPITVLLLTYFLLLFLMTAIAPRLATSLEDTNSSVVPFFQSLWRAGAWLAPWWYVPPLVLLLLVVLWWRQTSRSLVLEPRVGLRWLGWIPLFGRLQHYSQLAILTRTLGLLIENGQPLPESMVLAAQATGSRRLGRVAGQVRQAIEQGSAPAEALRRCGLPPLICWLLGASTPPPDLAHTLKRLADDYHQRATHQAEKIRLLLPLLLTVGIAGTAVAAYALILFLPWTTALRELAGP